MTIEFLFNAYEFPNACEALQYSDEFGGVAIALAGHFYVVQQADADRVAAQGVEFSYLCEHEMLDCTHRIVTIPVN